MILEAYFSLLVVNWFEKMLDIRNVVESIDTLKNVAYYLHLRAHRCRNYPPGYRTSSVVQNDAGGYDLRGIAGPFFREDNPAGSSGGSFIMHSHL